MISSKDTYENNESTYKYGKYKKLRYFVKFKRTLQSKIVSWHVVIREKNVSSVYK